MMDEKTAAWRRFVGRAGRRIIAARPREEGGTPPRDRPTEAQARSGDR